MAIRAWMDGDLRLARRLLEWAEPKQTSKDHNATNPADGPGMSFQTA